MSTAECTHTIEVPLVRQRGAGGPAHTFTLAVPASVHGVVAAAEQAATAASGAASIERRLARTGAVLALDEECRDDAMVQQSAMRAAAASVDTAGCRTAARVGAWADAVTPDGCRKAARWLLVAATRRPSKGEQAAVKALALALCEAKARRASAK